jgi:predicted small lipoprotein YifL
MRRREPNGPGSAPRAPCPAPSRLAPSRLALAVTAWAVAACALGGCGQRGPLYLPEQLPERASGQPPAAGEAQQPDDDDGPDSADRDGGAE